MKSGPQKAGSPGRLKKTENTALTLAPIIPSHEEGGELGFEQPRRGDLGRTIIVQEGDTLDKLTKRIYGRSDNEIWEVVKKSNPDPRDIDFLRQGQKLFFPPLPEMQE
jgi:phage tail protein X